MVFIVTIITLLTIEKIFEDNFDQLHPSQVSIDSKNSALTSEEFFLGDFPHNQTIFLLGSSHVGNMNITQVNNLIGSDDVVVYNLAIGGDTLVKRLNDLDKIISSRPDVVFYGISYRDFQFIHDNTVIPLLPTIQQLDPCSKLHSILYDNLPSNPQWFVRNIFKNMIQPDTALPVATSSNLISIDNTPFYLQPKNPIIGSDSYMKTQQLDLLYWDDNIKKNQNICALHIIINELQKNDIKLVIFTTPLHKYYLDALSNSQKNEFKTLLQTLTNDYGLKIYQFEERYVGLNVWLDSSHFSTHQNVTIFNNDIAEMIIMEMP